MKEAVEQTEAVAEPAAAGGPTPLALTQAGRILALQRSAGNRAVAQLLARADTHARSRSTSARRRPGRTNVNWDASFDVTFDEDASTPTCG